jgi:hypothetical protein
MATSWISFGPDLEPLESEARRGAQTPPRRRDGVCVSGGAEEVVARLVEAAGTSCGWSRFDEVVEDGGLHSIFVNAATVRLVTEQTKPPR